MKLSKGGECDDALFDTPGDEPCPGIHIQIDTEQVNITCGTGLTDEHRRLSGVIQVACPLVEDRYFDYFGDMMLELRCCLCLVGAEVKIVDLPP